MLEDQLRQFLLQEIDDMCSPEDLKEALTDDDKAKLLWDYFAGFNPDKVRESVRRQVKYILNSVKDKVEEKKKRT